MALLDIDSVSVQFGGLLAVDDATLTVEPARITGLIGPNGAGKTTLFNVITGLRAPTRGRIRLEGADITRTRPHKRARLGIARTFQRLEAFGSLTAHENVLVALEMRKRWATEPYDSARLATNLLQDVGIASVADRKVETLPTGTARLVELARALATAPKVLLLDEPSSGLDEAETDALGKLLRSLAGDGLGILLVEHDMPFVMETCNHIDVLDFGRIIARGNPDEIQHDPAVQTAYLGTTRAMTILPISDAPVLELRAIRAGYGRIDVLHGVSLTLMPGEVYALLGPNGAGKSTTLGVASGQIIPSSGSVFVCGRDVTGVTPDALARAGVCLIPEGRGIFGNLTVAENLRMATFTGTSYHDVLERAFAQFPRLGERRKQTARTLSGGEQQMLSMARALATQPALLLIDELSMGLAPIIVEELYEHVRRIAASGLSILVVEQFAHEILGIAHRAGIMLHGRIVESGTPASIAEELAAAYLGAEH